MSAGSPDKKSVRVFIFNQPYSLVATGDPAEVEELAVMLDQLMNNIAARAGTNDATRAAVLASLHLADRLRSMERELNVLRQRVDEKSKEFSILLDQAIET
ncbi:MAG: cell division protein ZapA [Acidobacteria bacterium]|nr:cell division protein ZapA [Acidobacteriota bacterium]